MLCANSECSAPLSDCAELCRVIPPSAPHSSVRNASGSAVHSSVTVAADQCRTSDDFSSLVAAVAAAINEGRITFEKNN